MVIGWPTPLDLLDAARIRAGMAPDAAAGLAALDVAWTLESTNTTLLAQPAPEHGVAVLLAERQTRRPWPARPSVDLAAGRAHLLVCVAPFQWRAGPAGRP